LRRELPNHGGNYLEGRRGGEPNHLRAPHALGNLPGVCNGRLQTRVCRCQIAVSVIAQGSGSDQSAGSFEKEAAHAPLQRGKQSAHPGLRIVQSLGCPAKVQFVGQRLEGLNLL
jgi:hypothetical protein